ncbi:Mur ligase middle domain protein [Methanocaldococcus villosus KIN24-T80]|uniref:Mur ligase middle domain protein n=1 Tax=Methanocaldococcus villosus KIN24-T80 TaxID=1069083 RepID=N6VPJ3_9EURY|nr:coenzyme F430 synthase [Methanocaldococcus villosus]ENN95815.1 Mur ligase middle domain protein [Methanocaldococcus villosus KIN24-T80]
MLIVDVNHGALILAREYKEMGYDVEVWDIYNKLKDSNNLDVKIVKNPNLNDYEKIVAPIHCPIDKKFISFHEAVSEIILKKYKNLYKKFICITGVKGKTTTTELIFHILKEDYKVFINNSNYGSIAPPAILEKLSNINIDDYDIFIFETSLGLIRCKYGAITNVLENYKIAKGKRDALFAKFSTLKLADVGYINIKDIKRYNLAIEKNNINVINEPTILKKYPLEFEYCGEIFNFNNKVFGSHLAENASFAIEICKNFLSLEDIKEKLKNFKIKNRMEIENVGKHVVIKNINPGLDVKAIKYAINDFLEVFGGDIYIGGDFGVVCEEIDIKKLCNILKSFKVKYFFIGDIGKELNKYLEGEFKDKIEIKDDTLIILRTRIK